MRALVSLLVLLVTTMNLSAETFVYVSLAPEQKIRVYHLRPIKGLTNVAGLYHELALVDDLAVSGSPGALAIDPQKRFLVASLRTNSTLASFAIDSTTGKLKPLSTAALPKMENAAFVATDRTGRWLLSASYMGGKVVVHRLGADGMIQTPPVQTVSTAVTAHACVQDADNRWVFVPHVTPNAIYQFKLDAASGMLSEAGKADGGTPKAGPRHLAFHPKLSLAFSSDEVGSSITAYQFDKATGLKAIETLSTLPAGFKGKNTTAEVKVHPSGKFVWVSNRGHDSLAGFRIDDKTGKLSSLGQTPTEKTPRSFDITPDGRYVLGAGEGSGKLAVYEVDTATGALKALRTYEVGKSLTWVRAVTY